MTLAQLYRLGGIMHEQGHQTYMVMPNKTQYQRKGRFWVKIKS